MTTPRITFPADDTYPQCRICTGEATVLVHPNWPNPPAYPYCAKCVNEALERAEVHANR